MTPALLTPEHLQLYSDQKLEATAKQGLPQPERAAAWKRLARLEQLRRTCSVPLPALRVARPPSPGDLSRLRPPRAA